MIGDAAHGSGSRPSTWSVPGQAARRQQHHEEQRRGREADDDGGQDERLRQRIGVLRGIAGRARRQDGSGSGTQPPHRDDEEIDRIGEQRQADDHLKCAWPQDQPHARARERSDAEERG